MIPLEDIIVNVRFNETGVDESGNGHTAVPVGATYETVDPILGSGSAKFGGLNETFVIADAPDLTFAGGFGMAIWIEHDPTDTGYSSYIQKWAPGQREFFMLIGASDNLLEMNIYDESANAFLQRSWGTANIFDGNKHLIRVNYDGGTLASGLTMKVDNIPRGDAASSGTFAGIENLGADIVMGGEPSVGYIKGLEDELLIINKPYTAAQDTWLWNDSKGREIDYDVAAGNINRKLSKGLARGLGRGI